MVLPWVTKLAFTMISEWTNHNSDRSKWKPASHQIVLRSREKLIIKIIRMDKIK